MHLTISNAWNGPALAPSKVKLRAYIEEINHYNAMDLSKGFGIALMLQQVDHALLKEKKNWGVDGYVKALCFINQKIH